MDQAYSGITPRSGIFFPTTKLFTNPAGVSADPWLIYIDRTKIYPAFGDPHFRLVWSALNYQEINDDLEWLAQSLVVVVLNTNDPLFRMRDWHIPFIFTEHSLFTCIVETTQATTKQ